MIMLGFHFIKTKSLILLLLCITTQTIIVSILMEVTIPLRF